MKNKIIRILIVILLFTLLTGCAAPAQTPIQPKGGTVYITVNPVIAVTYDENGNVTAVEAVSEDAQSIVDGYSDFIGKECTEVVTELVTKIGEEGYLSKEKEEVTISISFEEKSGVPHKDFTKQIEQKVQAVVAEKEWKGTVTVEEPPLLQETPGDTSSGKSEDDSFNNDIDSTTSDVGSKPSDSTDAAPNVGDPNGTSKPSGGEHTTPPADSKPSDEGSTPPVTSNPSDGNTPQPPVDSNPSHGNTAPEPPAAEPIDPDDTPDDVQKQPDGTYVRTEQLNADKNPVDSNPTYIRTTLFRTDGAPLEQRIVYAGTEKLAEHHLWVYNQAGVVTGHTAIQYNKSGSIKEQYQDEYDANGNRTQRTVFNADGTKQVLQTYDKNGILTGRTSWHDNGQVSLQEELYPNGNTKGFKRWDENGKLTEEFTAFHDRDNNNGTVKRYDEQGKLQGIDIFGNPDGSPDSSEWWDVDGSHIVTTLRDGQPIKVVTTRPNGNTISEEYDFEAGTIHIISHLSDFVSDQVVSMETGEPISGYSESTSNGLYRYMEYVDGYKCKQILDGEKNPLGFKYKETTTYYPNGQTKTSERYFYKDGGHLYVEFDENGKTIFSEDTTECNYAEI